VVYHTRIGEQTIGPFFSSIKIAEKYLEGLAEEYGSEQYEHLVLRKTEDQKIADATEILTEQTSLVDWEDGENRGL